MYILYFMFAGQLMASPTMDKATCEFFKASIPVSACVKVEEINGYCGPALIGQTVQIVCY